MQAYTVNTWLPPVTGKPPEANEVQRRLWTALQRRDLPGQTTTDQYALANQYTGANYIALNAIATGFSTSTMQVLKRKPGSKSLAFNANDANSMKDWLPVDGDEGPARLFANPNDQQTPSRFAADYVTYRGIFGRTFIYAPPARSGKPVELWNIPAQYVQPVYQLSADYPYGAWRVTLPMPFMYGFGGSSGTVIIDARQMVEERMLNIRFPYDGFSALTAGAQQIDTYNAINEARKNTMDRGPSPDAMVAISGVSQDELLAKKAEFENKYTGSRGSRVMFTSGEDVKATPLGIAAKDMDFGSGYDQLTNFILALHGADHLTSMTNASSYAQLYALLQKFRTMTLIPMANEVSAHWTKHLIQKHWGDDFAVTFVFPPLINPDSEQQKNQQRTQMGTITVNEERAKNNEDPVEGGDVPVAVYLAGLTAKQQAAMQPPPQPGLGDAGPVPDDAEDVPAKPTNRIADLVGLPTPPKNTAGKGSLPPRVGKAMLRKSLRYIDRILKAEAKS